MARCAASGYTATDVLKSFIVAVADGAASPDAYHPKKHPRARELSDNAVLNWLKGKKPESGN